MRRRHFCIAWFAWLLMAPIAVCAQLLPDTEAGNVIVRKLDQIEIPLTPTYIGHAGIFGLWKGNNYLDSTDFTIYDMQATTSMIKSGVTYFHTTVSSRTFQAFTTVNSLIGLEFQTYAGGYVRADTFLSPGGSPMDPTLRQLVVDQASTWVGLDLTTKLFPFTKKASSNTFRCDGFVEYVLESAGVGNGQGLWRNKLEPLIIAPITYVSSLVARQEPVA